MVSIFNKISQIIRGKTSKTVDTSKFLPLDKVTKTLLTSEELAFYLGLDKETCTKWEMGQGSFRPTTEKIGKDYWVRWKLSDVKKYKNM